jgi:hypothetical protein
LELIKDNYLRGSGSEDTWHVDIDPPKRKVKSYFEETLLTAEYMYANKTGKLMLMLSGGLDSEYVFRVFHHLKFDFTPVIVRFVGKHHDKDYNFHDTISAFELCKNYNITPTVITFDFDKFVDSGELFENMHRFHAGGFGVATLLNVVASLDGFTVYGNDPPYMRLNNGVWQLEEEEMIHAILRAYKGLNLNGCPFLLSYTPEMMLSFLLDPRIVDLANGMYPGKTGTNSSKSYVFNNGSGFNLTHYDFARAEEIHKNGISSDFAKTPRIKLHGFEVIARLPWFQNQLEVKKNFNQSDKPRYMGCYKEDYHDVVKRLSIHQ